MFISSETMIVEQLEGICNRVAGALFPERRLQDALPSLFAAVESARATNRRNWHVRRQFALCRYVDNYLTYLSEMMSEVLKAHPQALRSKEQVTLEDVLKHPSLQEFIDWQVEERVSRLAFRGFGEIAEYVRQRLGVELIQSAETRKRIIRAIATRNVLVHQRGIADSRYLEALRSTEADINVSSGERLSGEEIDHFEAMSSELESVRDVDKRVSDKFALAQFPVTVIDWPGARQV